MCLFHSSSVNYVDPLKTNFNLNYTEGCKSRYTVLLCITFIKFRNVVLEEDGEVQLDRSCEK